MAVPWVPLLTLASSFLGPLFGNQTKESTQQNSTTNTLGGSTSTQALDSTGTQNVQQQQNSNDVTQGESEQVVNRLDSTTMQSLTTGVQKLLQDAGMGSSAIKAELDAITGNRSDFDPKAFVSGIMQSARAENDMAMEAGSNRIQGRTGVNTGTNSAAALLDAKLKRQGVANLAGIEANAVAQGEQIAADGVTSRAGAVTNLASGASNELSTMLTSLLNAGQTSKDVTKQVATGVTSGTTNQQTVESQKQKQDSISTQKQDTIATGTGASSQHDWSKMFEGIGGILSAKF